MLDLGEKMICILLLVGLTSSVCGTFAVKMAQTVYQAGENQNVIISWDSGSKADMSLTNLLCVLLSKPVKLLYEMINGVQQPESQHQQFAGRVQCDKDALREGRFRLHVSRVTTEDSGKYLCEVAANYDELTRRWGLEHTERFVLNVTSDGESSDDFFTTAKSPEAGPPKEDEGSRDRDKVKIGLGVANCVIVIFGGLICLVCAAERFLTSMFCRGKRD